MVPLRFYCDNHMVVQKWKLVSNLPFFEPVKIDHISVSRNSGQIFSVPVWSNTSVRRRGCSEAKFFCLGTRKNEPAAVKFESRAT